MAKANEPLLYYSVNTEIAYRINERFYGGSHFVWCSPVFDPTKAVGKYSGFSGIGPTSNPHLIYCELKSHAESRDLHSAKIQANKSGIIRGATEKLKDKIINPTEFAFISQIVDKAESADFKPYIYLIPTKKIIPARLKKVMPNHAATISGIEYKIEDLQSSEFDIIEVNPW